MEEPADLVDYFDPSESIWPDKVLEVRSRREAHKEKLGRLTVEERVRSLCDPGSVFPVGEFARLQDGFYDDLPESVIPPTLEYGDGVLGGVGRIEGRPVCFMAQDASVFGGSGGPIGGRIFRRVTEIALRRSIPLVMILDGGGHRIQDGLDSRHFADTGSHFEALAQLSGVVPMVTLVLGEGFAGNTNYAGLSDFVVMVDNQSTMGIAGPALVAAATGEVIHKYDLGGAEVQVDMHGLAHLRCPDELSAINAVRTYLSYLPSNCDAATERRSYRDSPELDSLDALVPASSRRAYDMRTAVIGLTDLGSFFEIQPTYARNVIVGFARIGGVAVGVVANQPMVLAGTLDYRACEKMARFISLCDAFGVPLVFIADIPGFLVGTEAEKSMLGRRSARIIFELGRSTVPRISIISRKGYGLGFLAMAGGRSFSADLAIAWPSAEICAMNVQGAVEVAFKRQIQQAPDPAEEKENLLRFFASRVSPERAAEGFGVDAVVRPSQTRRMLVDLIPSLPRRTHSNNISRNRGISPI